MTLILFGEITGMFDRIKVKFNAECFVLMLIFSVFFSLDLLIFQPFR